MNDDERAGHVLDAVRQNGRQLPYAAETRCPHDGRRLGVAFWFPDGLWLWAAGYREPPQAARVQAAAFYLDALDECQTAGEEKACYDAASEALSADIRPVARPSVMHVDIDPADIRRAGACPWSAAPGSWSPRCPAGAAGTSTSICIPHPAGHCGSARRSRGAGSRPPAAAGPSRTRASAPAKIIATGLRVTRRSRDMSATD